MSGILFLKYSHEKYGCLLVSGIQEGALARTLKLCYNNRDKNPQSGDWRLEIIT
ncbi:MAG: hypothetical protein ACD_51C00330G0002 [uncultured bacterium]|nr:MAG: hypothetical protein ACD_51C00330G0002 [uncultured bacterium]